MDAASRPAGSTREGPRWALAGTPIPVRQPVRSPFPDYSTLWVLVDNHKGLGKGCTSEEASRAPLPPWSSIHSLQGEIPLHTQNSLLPVHPRRGRGRLCAFPSRATSTRRALGLYFVPVPLWKGSSLLLASCWEQMSERAGGVLSCRDLHCHRSSFLEKLQKTEAHV